MESVGISIIVPVGPQPEYKKYLKECLDSIAEQMTENDQVIIVDDQANVDVINDIETAFSQFLLYQENGLIYSERQRVTYYLTPWLVGCADAWNFGVSFAKNDLCLLMGSDDRLYPDCLDELREAYLAHDKMDAWYNLTIEITEGPDVGVHSVFNNAAAITRSLWKRLGGFPPSAGVGGPDALLLSIMMVYMSERMIQVKEGVPLYWCRHHSAQDTPRQAGFFSDEIVSIRNKETLRFVEYPEWTKNI